MNSAACARRAAREPRVARAAGRPTRMFSAIAAVEHRRILRHVGDDLPQRGLRHAIDRLAADAESRRVSTSDEAQQQPRQRRLAAARAADEADSSRPARIRSEKLLEQQRLLGRYRKLTSRSSTLEVRRRERARWRPRRPRRRVEQELGELRRVGQEPFQVAIDAVELPHHARRRRVVAEREEHRLEAGARCRGRRPARRRARGCS